MANLKTWFEGLHFMQPSYLIFFSLVGLMALTLLAVVLLKLYRRPRKSKFSHYQLLGKDLAWLWAIVICVFSVVALAGPRISEGLVLSSSGSIDVLVLMDNTFSMRGDDIVPTRQEAAKTAALNLVEKGILKKGDRVSLFVFGGIARWRMPLSEDFNEFKVKIGEITHPDVYEEEAQLDTNFAYLLEYVPRGLDKQTSFAKENRFSLNLAQYNNNCIAFFFSDGNNEGSGKLDVGIRELNKKNIKVYSVGIGTEAGTKVTVRAYDMKDAAKPPEKITIRTRLEMKDMARIAQSTQGDSFVLDSASKIFSLESFMRSAVDVNRSSLPRLVYSDEGRDIWWEVLAIPAVVLLCLIIWRSVL